MDKINFLAKDDFPGSSDTLNRLQEATSMVSTLALLGGSNYILSGCNEKESIVEPGIIVLDGEILPFRGGNIQEYIIVKETRKTLEAFDELYPEAYIDRIVIFADEGKIKWSDFKRILSNGQLQTLIADIKGDSPGTVKMWAGSIVKIPQDYKLCNGDRLSKDQYPELFECLGVSFGGDGVNDFALPDLKGRFVVGYDYNSDDYKEISNKGVGGNAKVTLTESEMPRHRHKYSDDTNAQGRFPEIEPGFPQTYGGISTTQSSGSNSGSGTVYYTSHEGGKDGVTQAHENRPPFFVLAYIIKVK